MGELSGNNNNYVVTTQVFAYLNTSLSSKGPAQIKNIFNNPTQYPFYNKSRHLILFNLIRVNYRGTNLEHAMVYT